MSASDALHTAPARNGNELLPQSLMDAPAEAPPIAVDMTAPEPPDDKGLVALRTVVERAGIDAIIMVDDDAPDVRHLEGAINFMAAPPQTLQHKITPQEWPTDPEDRFRLVCTALDAESFDQRRALTRDLYSEVGEGDAYQREEGVLPISLARLRDEPSNLIVSAVGPREWEQHHPSPGMSTEGKSIPAGKRTLVLFDMDLTNAGGHKDGGLRFAREYVNKQGTEAICGIISKDFREGHLSKDAARYLPKPDDRDRYVFAAKETLDGDPGSFAFQVARAVTAPEAVNLRDLAKETLKKAHSKALSAVATLDLDVLLYAVVHRSAEEGIGGFETLCRLYQVEFGEAILSTETENGQLQKAVADLRKLVPEWIWTAPTSVYNVKHRELYPKVELVNRALSPVQLGDVFKLRKPSAVGGGSGKWKKFVLVMQPCDLTVRESGRREVRKDYETETAVLLPLRSSKVKRKEVPQAGFLLPAYHNPGNDGRRSDGFVDFRPELYVPLRILDLCAFSTDGKAAITPSLAAAATPPSQLAGLPASLCERYLALERWARNVVVGAEPSSSANGVRTLNVPLGACEAVAGNVKDGTLAYECHRIGRVSAALAADLLLEFKRYSSRTAHAMDLLGREDEEDEEEPDDSCE